MYGSVSAPVMLVIFPLVLCFMTTLPSCPPANLPLATPSTNCPPLSRTLSRPHLHHTAPATTRYTHRSRSYLCLPQVQRLPPRGSFAPPHGFYWAGSTTAGRVLLDDALLYLPGHRRLLMRHICLADGRFNRQACIGIRFRVWSSRNLSSCVGVGRWLAI